MRNYSINATSRYVVIRGQASNVTFSYETTMKHYSAGWCTLRSMRRFFVNPNCAPLQSNVSLLEILLHPKSSFGYQ